MTKFVVDSWSWIEYLNGTEKGMKIKEIIEDTSNQIFTSIVSFSEIMSFVSRKSMDVEIAGDTINSNSEIISLNKGLAKETGLFHAEIRKKIHDFGLGDAFVVITARSVGAKVLTGDPHFKNMKEAVMI